MRGKREYGWKDSTGEAPVKLRRADWKQAEDGFGAVSVKSGRQVRNLALNGIRPLQRKSVDGTR